MIFGTKIALIRKQENLLLSGLYLVSQGLEIG